MDYKDIIIKENGKSGRMYVEKYVKNNYPKIFEEIVEYCKCEIDNIPFKEKVYHYVNNMPDKVYCNNPECDNIVKYKNSTIGYYKYCSKKCISDDPKIKKIKEKKSIEKYNTKTPSMNDEVKSKMINTNIKKYGHNSPLQNNNIKKKSIKTLMNNHGVDNPTKSKSISNKRILSYKKNLKVKWLDILKPYGIKNINYDKKIMYFSCIECKKDFELHLDLFHNRKISNTTLCTNCNPIDKHISGQEIKLAQFIKNNYEGDIILNDRKTLKPYELDIYIPKLNLAFEFNGLYWHNELHKENNYHFDKTELSENKNIKLIQIWEDNWVHKQEITKSIILNQLGKSSKIYARKTEVKEIIDNNISRDFLNKNHIQGFIGSQIKLGLFHNDKLVSFMSFGKQRKNLGSKSKKNVYELLRFCNKLNTNVIGGASKLFKYFIKNYKPIEIITYADRSFSKGDLYYKLGFNFVHKTKPNYYYILNKTRKNRFNFRKDVLIKEGYDPKKTEHKIMLERKIYRIYDSGQLKFVWKGDI